MGAKFSVITTHMYRNFPVLLLILLICVGCRPLGIVEVQSAEKVFKPGEFSEISVEISSGRVSIVHSDEPQIYLLTNLAEPENLIITQSEPVLSISLEKGKDQDEIILHIPDEMAIKVSTFSADVSLEAVTGIATIRSTAGDIRLESFSGQAQLWAGRGNVAVTNGQGELDLIGEHGALVVDGFNGKVSMTTIMGAINFFALENDLPNVQLESDHGPVKAFLPKNSRSNIKVTTTSGIVTCIGEGIIPINNGCERKVENGAGDVMIRTVSGRVDLRVTDNSVSE